MSVKVIGRKHDGGKAPVMKGFVRYFPKAMESVAKVSEYGAKKYDWHNWANVDDGFDRYSDAMMRHLLLESIEDHDDESGLLHAAHAAWNAMCRLELLLRGLEAADASITDRSIESQSNRRRR